MSELSTLKTRLDNATSALDAMANGISNVWADVKALVELAKAAQTPAELAAVDVAMTALEGKLAKVSTDVTAIDAEFPVPTPAPQP